MTQARVGNAHPSRAAFISKTNNVDSTEQIRMVLKDLVEAVQFRSDSNDGTGNAKVNLAQSAPVATIVNTCRVALSPYGDGNGNAINPVPKPIAMVQGTINQDIPAVSPAVGSDNTTPTVQMAVRGFNNHALTSADGYLPDATYSAAIPSQELHFTVNVGGKQLYGRVPLSETPDDAVPRPLLGWSGTQTVNVFPSGVAAPTTLAQALSAVVSLSDQVLALKQMHNDLAQSILTHGLFRLVSRQAGLGQSQLRAIPLAITMRVQANAILTPHSVR